MRKYTIIVTEEPDGFIARCLERSGAIGQGDSVTEAVSDLMEAIRLLEEPPICTTPFFVEGNIADRPLIVYDKDLGDWVVKKRCRDCPIKDPCWEQCLVCKHPTRKLIENLRRRWK